MNPTPQPVGRRDFIRLGGMAISVGAVVAACGTDQGVTAPGRIGLADEGEELEAAEVNDIVLMRTAQSLEYTALDVYDAALGTGALNDEATDLLGRFVEDHTRHAGLVGSIIDDLGGEQFMCANPFLARRAVAPILAALEGTDDLVRDLANTSYAIEELAGKSYQALVPMIEDLSLRTAAMQIGGEEQRHATAVALVLNPDEWFSPAMFGEPLTPDADGFPIRYAIPATFGQLSGVPLVVGAPDEEGARFTIQLQTPAENSLVYENQSC